MIQIDIKERILILKAKIGMQKSPQYSRQLLTIFGVELDNKKKFLALRRTEGITELMGKHNTKY